MGWDKPIPDLLIKRIDRTVVYIYASPNSIKNGTAVNRWEEFYRLGGIQVRLVVKCRKLVKLLTRIKKEKGLHGRIVWLHRKKRFSFHRLKEKVTSKNLMILASIVMIVVIVSLLMSGLVPNMFQVAAQFDQSMQKQMKIYQPRDIERQSSSSNPHEKIRIK